MSPYKAGEDTPRELRDAIIIETDINLFHLTLQEALNRAVDAWEKNEWPLDNGDIDTARGRLQDAVGDLLYNPVRFAAESAMLNFDRFDPYACDIIDSINQPINPLLRTLKDAQEAVDHIAAIARNEGILGLSTYAQRLADELYETIKKHGGDDGQDTSTQGADQVHGNGIADSDKLSGNSDTAGAEHGGIK